MRESEGAHTRSGNRLLDALPPGELERLRPHLEAVRMERRETVYDTGESIGHVYFPTTGVFSLVTTMQDGSVIEVATVGNEGMLGLQSLPARRRHAPERLLAGPGRRAADGH